MKQVKKWGPTVAVGSLAYLALGAFVTYQETGEIKSLLQPLNLVTWPYQIVTNGSFALDANASVDSTWSKLFGGQQ